MDRTDYPDAHFARACARKKAYPTEQVARRAAAKMTEWNASATAKQGFEGVVVHAYGCTRCGAWHVGR